MPCFNAPARTTRHDTACQPFTCALHDHPVLVQRQQRPHSDSARTDDGHDLALLSTRIICGEQCTSGASRVRSEGCRDHDAGARATDDPRGGPCQRFARNYATRDLTSPHNPTLGSASHLRGYVGT
jgi:hypothetical protein